MVCIVGLLSPWAGDVLPLKVEVNVLKIEGRMQYGTSCALLPLETMSRFFRVGLLRQHFITVCRMGDAHPASVMTAACIMSFFVPYLSYVHIGVMVRAHS